MEAVMRYYMLDRIEEIRYGDYITAVKGVSLSEDLFNEHFPGNPLFPGSLIMEALAQTAGSLFELTMMHENRPVLRSVLSIVNRMKFRNPAYPGDRIILKAKVVSVREESGVAAVTAEIDGAICAQGELTFTFVNVSNAVLEANRAMLYETCMRRARIIP
jgi:3-hydroxyacyl-[acyl-carrier-protein] dehydratase